MLQTRTPRPLLVAAPGGGAPQHLSAASGLVAVGDSLFVVADDELQLGRFALRAGGLGQLVVLFDGELPPGHDLRKARKPDCEALALLPAFGAFPHGALLALGSGSRPTRERAALVPLDAAGAIGGPVRSIDAGPLLAPLRVQLPELNIEGAFVQDGRLCLLQRGNGRSGINARIDFDWPEARRWLGGDGPAPPALALQRFELGHIDGVPLSFTDGAALEGGEWLFSAAAEDTADTYADGACAGSAVGIVDAAGTLRRLERLAPNCKVEGIAVTGSGHGLELLLVTDADDRSRPGLLLAATLPR